jgi:hypothetical protein
MIPLRVLAPWPGGERGSVASPPGSVASLGSVVQGDRSRETVSRRSVPSTPFHPPGGGARKVRNTPKYAMTRDEVGDEVGDNLRRRRKDEKHHGVGMPPIAGVTGRRDGA